MSFKAIFKELNGTTGVDLLTEKNVLVYSQCIWGWVVGRGAGSNLKTHTEGYGLIFKEVKQIVKIEEIIKFSPSSL